MLSSLFHHPTKHQTYYVYRRIDLMKIKILLCLKMMADLLRIIWFNIKCCIHICSFFYFRSTKKKHIGIIWTTQQQEQQQKKKKQIPLFKHRLYLSLQSLIKIKRFYSGCVLNKKIYEEKYIKIKKICITNDYYDFWLLAFAVCEHGWCWAVNLCKKTLLTRRIQERREETCINYLNNTFVYLSKSTDLNSGCFSIRIL